MYVNKCVLISTILLHVAVLPAICKKINNKNPKSAKGNDEGTEDNYLDYYDDYEEEPENAEGSESSSWNYGNVDDWSTDYPECGGDRQSPIDIDFSVTVSRRQNVSNLRYVNYEVRPESMTIENNGHTVEITGVWESSQRPYITGGTLSGQYVFEQFHFHWGNGNPFQYEGAEHTFDGKTLPLELHIVHYKRRYGSIEEAVKYPDGVVVIGRVFWVNGKENTALEALKNYIGLVTEPETERQIPPFPLADFDFNLDDNYITYNGSLTTPPCTEVVTWILPTKPLWVTDDVLRRFRAVNLNGGDTQNFRPVQPLNGRTITLVVYNYDLPKHYRKKHNNNNNNNNNNHNSNHFSS